MRKTVLALVAVGALGTGSADASPIVAISGMSDGYGYVGLGGLGAESWTPSGDVFCYGDADVVAACNQSPLVHMGFIVITSGALVDITVEDGPVYPMTTYMFGAGEVEIDFSWTNSDGATETGYFRAPVFNLVNSSGAFLKSVVTECPACSDTDHHTQDTFEFGAGLFDANLARRLGLSRDTLGGSYSFYLEQIDGDASSVLRHGNLNAPSFSIVAVPEPPLAILLTLAGLASGFARLTPPVRSAASRRRPRR